MIKAVKPYIGFILIVAGLVLTFAGMKFIFYAFSFLIFLLAAGLIAMISYNLLPSGYISPIVLGVILAVAVILGAVVAWLTKKFAEEWSVALLAAWGGVGLGLIVAKTAGVRSGAASLAIAVVGGIAGGYLGRKMNHLAKCAGTAFVGSFLVVRGAGCLAPEGYGYPSEFQMGSDITGAEATAIWPYLGGLVVLTVAGSLTQLYLFRDIGGDKDDLFERQEEGRVCGCF